ncbi:MAG: hypothetical protein WCF17_11810 [Terracidiphilus sp.]
MATALQELDWVRARMNCSVLTVFNELRLGVEADVKIANAMPRPSELPSLLFGFRSNTVGDYFIVFRHENAGARVEFNCEANRIVVRNQDREFSVTLTLNNEGRCKLRVDDGEELEQWQVRRIALEKLFFENS